MDSSYLPRANGAVAKINILRSDANKRSADICRSAHSFLGTYVAHPINALHIYLDDL